MSVNPSKNVFDFCLMNLSVVIKPLKDKQCIVIRFSWPEKAYIAQNQSISFFLFSRCCDTVFNPYTYVLYQDRDKVCRKHEFLVDCCTVSTGECVDEHIDDDVGLNPRPNAHQDSNYKSTY